MPCYHPLVIELVSIEGRYVRSEKSKNDINQVEKVDYDLYCSVWMFVRFCFNKGKREFKWRHNSIVTC